MEALRHTAHRPWPLPPGPWLMAQTWERLLFAHWPVDPAVLRPLIPPGLALDTFGGTAWVGVVPFDITHAHARYLPPLPYLSHFLELNVRTYVVAEAKPGVWFFSLDAASPLAVAGARRFFHLPYFNARMSADVQQGWVHYRSRRTHKGAPPAEFAARYRPLSAPYKAQSGSLEHWLTERYCLYSRDPRGRIWRDEIHHVHWPLQRAEGVIERNTIASAHGIALPPQEPLLHYSERLEVAIWPLRPTQPR
jgi:uncharacterized protein YqjF (DUF2071 family)